MASPRPCPWPSFHGDLGSPTPLPQVSEHFTVAGAGGASGGGGEGEEANLGFGSGDTSPACTTAARPGASPAAMRRPLCGKAGWGDGSVQTIPGCPVTPCLPVSHPPLLGLLPDSQGCVFPCLTLEKLVLARDLPVGPPTSPPEETWLSPRLLFCFLLFWGAQGCLLALHSGVLATLGGPSRMWGIERGRLRAK